MSVADLAQQLVAAYNDKDADAFARLFEVDAEFVNVMGDRQRGSAQIRAAHRHAFATVLAGTSLSLENLDVSQVGDGVELGVLEWRRERAADAPALGAPAGTGVFSLVARRQNVAPEPHAGLSWLLAAASNVPVTPIPGPRP